MAPIMFGNICNKLPTRYFFDSEQIPNIWASSTLTQKQKVLKPLRFQDFYWSEWRDLNSRPLDPQSSALPTALHPDIFLMLSRGSQLVHISMPIKKMQALFQKKFKKFLNWAFQNFVDKNRGVWYHKQVPEWRTLPPLHGEMSERLKEPVLKTGDVKASVGSNPTLSATILWWPAEVPKRPKGLPC